MYKLIVVLIIIILVGGLGYIASQSNHRFEHHSLMEKIQENQVENLGQEREIPKEKYLKVGDRIGSSTFYTEKREHLISSFSCKNCHNSDLNKLSSPNPLMKNAHWDININHGGDNNLSCTNCHNSNNLDKLTTITGENISYDKSYRLCASCHSGQHNDWLGGAHGKALEGWKTPRIMKTCVGCHNPHDPEIKSRWPSRSNSYSLINSQN